MKLSRFIYTFIITLAIFFLALWLSNMFGNKKIQSLRDLENQISLNILSVETRFSLLQKTSCDHITASKDDNAGFNKDLNDLALRVKSLENQLGYYNEDVISLKQYYSLLQIKDYLLTKEYHERCKQDTVTVLYFHTVDCPECGRQAIILDKLMEEYPEIRVYYFDLTTNTPALDTLSSIYKIRNAPALVIGDKLLEGFQDIDKVKSLIPEVKIWDKERLASSTTATTSTSTPTTTRRTR